VENAALASARRYKFSLLITRDQLRVTKMDGKSRIDYRQRGIVSIDRAIIYRRAHVGPIPRSRNGLARGHPRCVSLFMPQIQRSKSIGDGGWTGRNRERRDSIPRLAPVAIQPRPRIRDPWMILRDWPDIRGAGGKGGDAIAQATAAT